MDWRIASWLPLALLLAPACAGAAEIEWNFVKRDGRPFLYAMPKEPEVDNEFWARCRTDKSIAVGAGAEHHVGRGEGEAVTLTFSAGQQRATLAGVLRKSANFGMTGGTELQAVVGSGHALFKVLADGRPIEVTGPIKTLTWAVPGLKSKLAAFLKACR